MEEQTSAQPAGISLRRSVRGRVLGMTVMLAFLTYMDRVCISVTAPAMMRDLRLSPIQMGFAFSAFTAAYALFEIPTGWWADRIGSRKVLTRIVVWWSVFTGLTAVSWNFTSLVILRGLFGAGEAGAWPTVARALSRWFPARERGTAQGIFFMGAHLGGGIAPIVVTAIAVHLGWRAAFPTLSLLGFAWAVGWFLWFRDEPREHGSVSQAEVAWIEDQRGNQSLGGHAEHAGGLLRVALRTPGIWFLCLMYFTQTYGFNLYVTWLPTYLVHEKKLSGSLLSVLAGLPLLLSVAADFAGGLATDWLSRVSGLRLGRCVVGFVSLGSAAVFLFLGSRAPGWQAAVLIALAGAAANLLLGASWATCSDVAGNHAAVLGAAMNTAGQVGGLLSPIVFAYLTRGRASWAAPLECTAALYMLGAFCWYFVHPERPLALSA
jgi:ACS family glucarate transporter-like MFS transporter